MRVTVVTHENRGSRRHDGIPTSHTQTHQYIHSMSAQRVCLPAAAWLVQITHRGFRNVRIKVRDLITKAPNSAKNRMCRLHQRSGWKIMLLVCSMKTQHGPETTQMNFTFLKHADETCTLSSQTHILLLTERRGDVVSGVYHINEWTLRLCQ